MIIRWFQCGNCRRKYEFEPYGCKDCGFSIIDTYQVTLNSDPPWEFVCTNCGRTLADHFEKGSCKSAEPDGQAAACKADEVGSTPTALSEPHKQPCGCMECVVYGR